ncbi:MAG: GGDEF domain-containing protein [Thermodesulfobacteriota bacterium]
MKLFIPLICIITLLSNFVYIFYGSQMGRQSHESVNLFTYKTPDNEIWINKDKSVLERMRNHYIKGSDSIIASIEAENQQIKPLQHLEPETQEMLVPQQKVSTSFLIINSIIIISGFSVLYLVTLKRKQTEKPKSADHAPPGSEKQLQEIEPVSKNKKSVIDNKSISNGQIFDKAKDIICEILQIINKHSDSDIAPNKDSLDSFAREQVSRIKTSPTLKDFLAIEDSINKTIPKHFETTKNLVRVKFKELREMLNGLAEDFGSITKDNTNFSGHIKDSMSHIEKAIELDEIKEIRKKITLETTSLRKAIAKKQEKDAIIIDSLTHKVKTIQGELASAKEEVLIDGLTQIYNRKAFDKRIGDAFIKKSIKKTPFTLVMVDIDYFKKINDGYGHTVGDEVLKNIASTIKKSFRLNDFVARYGGEEFSVMIDRIDRNYILDVCERLRAAIEAINFTIDSERIPTTASIGIAFSSQTDTIRTLIERADRALYLAKQSGRNIVKSEEDLSSKKLEAVS